MRRLVLLVLLVVLVACSGGTGGSISIAGIWAVQSGNEVFNNLGSASLKYLRLNADGTGHVYAVHAPTNVLYCTSLLYTVLGSDKVLMSSDAITSTNAELYTYRMTGSSDLRLTNANGISQDFTKVNSVPANNVCEDAKVTGSLQNLAIDYDGWPNLLSDGANLRLPDASGIVHIINPTNGSIAGTENLGATYYDVPVTMQGATDYWGHCACGGSEDVGRYKAGAAPTDTINTRTDLSNQISVRMGAFDGTHLWLGGYSYANRVNRFLKINSNAEPDVLLGSFDFDQWMQAIAFHNGQLWGLVDSSRLVQIDPGTAKATRTIRLPAVGNGSYQGLTSLGGKLYVLVYYWDSARVSILAIEP